MADSAVTAVDGQLSWAGGVNSIKVTTMASERNPDGMARNELCWTDNSVLRDGGITTRYGYLQRGTVHDGTALFQGGYMYHPLGANPYLILSIGGRIYKVDCESFAVTDLSAVFSLTNPPTEPFANFVQGEEFLVIQAGDTLTLPLFWDGVTLRRSLGLPGQELPAATAMEYFMGRIWYAQGRQYTAGDIVGGPSGTVPYNQRDSILHVTENPLAIGGDGFIVPTQDGNIRALKAGGAIDAALGQGRLFVFSRKAVYALQVPVTRLNWIAASDSNQPLQTVVQLINGSVNDRSIVSVNGDLYYQSLEPGIRSLMQSVRLFNQPGNRQISANEQRILQFNDRSIMRGSSGILFNNYLLQTALPKQMPQGIIHQALIPLDFIPISSFGQEREPVWGGMQQGIDMLQLFVGDFGGRERGFALTVSRESTELQLWEITNTSRTDKVDGEEGNRIVMSIETPAFNWAGTIGELSLKKLVGCELWVDRLSGTVNFFLQYRVDSDACWRDWHSWKACSPRNSNETVEEPIMYPLVSCQDSYRANMSLPKPPESCASAMGRPAYIGFQFQLRLTVKGSVRIRGIYLQAQGVDRALYSNLVC